MNTATASYPAVGRQASPPAATAPELLRRAEQALNAGRLDEAAALYRQLLAANVAPGLQLFRLGLIANRRKDFDAAWELHYRALAADPELAAKVTPPTVPHHRVIGRPRYDTEEVRVCPVCGSAGQAPLMVVNCLPFNHYHPSFGPLPYRLPLGLSCRAPDIAPEPISRDELPPSAPLATTGPTISGPGTRGSFRN